MLVWVREYVAKRDNANEHLDPITTRISRMNLPTGDWEILENQIEAGRLSS